MPRFTTLSLMLLLAACSADEKDSRTRESFCQEWASAACSNAVVSACQSSSAEACRLTQQGFCLSLVPSTFSDAAADDCLAAVSAAYADATLAFPVEYHPAVELGTTAAGRPALIRYLSSGDDKRAT